MAKIIHEIRDPIHVFIRLDSYERRVLDSRPFQRLRYIHQLALTYLVYPGATHRRFEHSLGVMELASRVFDVVTNPNNVTDKVKNILPQINPDNKDELSYWRRVLRMAALCHDIGHLPFSHAAEKDLFPEGWDHERMTKEIILSDEMKDIWNDVIPPLKPEHIVKLALGQKKEKDLPFTDWENILSEIIVGDSFGVDRIDYLLRDSYHTGVAYGKFDHHRLIDTLRILPPSPYGNNDDISMEPSLGVEEGGIQSTEALLLARYFMYTQVYFRHVRRIYDIHLRDFLMDYLAGGQYPIEIEPFLRLSDNEITSYLRSACLDASAAGHAHAKRIIYREHFKRLYSRIPIDIQTNSESPELIKEAAIDKFGEEKIRFDSYPRKDGRIDFPVLLSDKSVESSLQVSETLNHIPSVAVDYIFVDSDILPDANKWLEKHKKEIIEPKAEEEEL